MSGDSRSQKSSLLVCEFSDLYGMFFDVTLA